MFAIRLDVRTLLSLPRVYDIFQNLMGAGAVRRHLVFNYIQPFPGCRILDIGCGTARILDYMPDVAYFGFDQDLGYIKEARERYGSRASFSCELIEETKHPLHSSYDVVVAAGVLHHLNDAAAIKLLQLADAALIPGGRLVTFDPCYTIPQNFIAKYLVSKDRGQYVRQANAYRELAVQIFMDVQSEVKHSHWPPYSRNYMVCRKPS